MYYGYDTETLYLHLLKQFNVDRSKIKETALQYDLSLFFNGQVDVWPAYAINQPLVAKQQGVAVRLLTPDQFGIRYYSDTIIVSDKTLKDRRQTVEKFLAASEKGWEYALSHTNDAVDIVMKADPHLDRNLQVGMLGVVADYFNKQPMFKMDTNVWESISAILQEQGSLKTPPALDDVADFSFAGQ
jgi:NitT/TauT family transport system substrate-binding protein